MNEILRKSLLMTINSMKTMLSGMEVLLIHAQTEIQPLQQSINVKNDEGLEFMTPEEEELLGRELGLLDTLGGLPNG
jgi:hypothetical protein